MNGFCSDVFTHVFLLILTCDVASSHTNPLPLHVACTLLTLFLSLHPSSRKRMKDDLVISTLKK